MAVVSYWRKDVHLERVNRLGLRLHRKSVDRLTDCLDMTIFVDWDAKQHLNKQTKLAMDGYSWKKSVG